MGHPFLPDSEANRFEQEARSLFCSLNQPKFGEPNGLGFVSDDSIVPDAARQWEIRSLGSVLILRC